MSEQFIRSEMLFGEDYYKVLQNKKVCVFGVGGVGGFVCESLARSGIGKIVLVDHDTVSISNINRQIIATHSTIGLHKVDVMKQRILDINPNAQVEGYKEFYLPGHELEAVYQECDYVVDAIDTVTAKLALIEFCTKKQIPIISSMGTGNKTKPNMFECTDIYKTDIDPLARVMRRELKKRNINSCKVVFSRELPKTPLIKQIQANGKTTPGSSPFVPASAGLLIASEVINDLLK